MVSLGKRIKDLRKKRKLTLETLAGNQLTKGMLSLIENDKAQPSMESLTYIASKLDIEVNELLATVNLSDLRELLEEATHKHYKDKDYQWVVEKVTPVLEEKLPLNYEVAKLKQIFGEACYHLKKEKWKSYLEEADALFFSLNFYNQSAGISFFLVWTEMNDHRYKDALRLLIQKKESLKEKQAELDVLTDLDFLYYETCLFFAIGDDEQASHRLKQTITLSNQKKILYRIEELYRIAYFYALMNKKEEDMTYYFNKLSLLAEFTENPDSKLNLMALNIYYYNTYLKNYDKALELIDELHDMASESLNYFYFMEKGKALYGKQNYEEALHYLLQFEEHSYWNHPFDLTFMYEVFAYIARCYQGLGQLDQAYQNAKYAMDHVTDMPDTPSKTFIKETLSQVIMDL